jgi:hypothetical protein
MKGELGKDKIWKKSSREAYNRTLDIMVSHPHPTAKRKI